jgi:flagellar motor switch protein FliM
MGAEILNQDEIDALLKGVDDGAVATTPPDPVGNDVRSFDLATQASPRRDRMPTLELINERFARLLRIGIYNMIRRTPEVTGSAVQILKYSDYLSQLQLPASLNLVKINPLRGASLFVVDQKLVFALVDNFFGGSGRQVAFGGREFTRTESRIVQLVLRQVYADMQEAWAPIAALQVEYLKTDINPNFANIAGPSDLVVVSAFRIELEGAGGDLQVTIPHAALEPMREVLDSGIQSGSGERDESWAQTLREEIEDAEVELTPVLGRARLTVGQLVDLRPGDVIPCDFEGSITLVAEGVPVLRGSYGTSRGQQAVKITKRIFKRRAPASQSAMSTP